MRLTESPKLYNIAKTLSSFIDLPKKIARSKIVIYICSVSRRFGEKSIFPQKRLEREVEQSRSEIEQLRDELKTKQKEIEVARQDYEAVQQRIEAFEAEKKVDREAHEVALTEKESLHKELSENKDQILQLKIEMGQASGKVHNI